MAFSSFHLFFLITESINQKKCMQVYNVWLRRNTNNKIKTCETNADKNNIKNAISLKYGRCKNPLAIYCIVDFIRFKKGRSGRCAEIATICKLSLKSSFESAVLPNLILFLIITIHNMSQ